MAFGSQREDRLGIALHEGEELRVADDSGLDAFEESGAQFACWKRLQNIDIGEDSQRMMEAADQILARLQVDAGLASD